MHDLFVFATITRQKFAQLVDSLTIEQLNTIPAHFNNNIAWHLGHIVVSTEILCYHRTGVQPERSIEWMDKYKNGSKPEGLITAAEIDLLKDRLQRSLEEIRSDYDHGVFKTIKPYQTMTFGFVMDNMETVLECCSHHDLLHLGNVSAMRKLV
ncbi:hypothetical protein DBR32_05415 [Taibaiella sp. KBW10]|uniref:DinB family protein n=1 Tax=Taibaiella sp. KBW10 TaxID=2153357 RepID=UPI000F5AC219|nr:DinB family protein [Taibaiella sp. KBW10]RQO31403.1 hypothetical protein DBR32_05415 [Taibaiella sp. KBW10]